MMNQNAIVGGVIITIDEKTSQGELGFLFVKVGVQGKGVGKQIQQEIEAMHPNIKVWKTCTSYFDKRNIHFYVNKLKFKIVRYFEYEESNYKQTNHDFEKEGGMFEFEKNHE